MINIQNNIWSISSFLKNKQHNFNKKNILAQLPAKFIDEAILGISNWDNYSPTPLIKLNKLNEILKLKNIYYKDEDKRFDLKSFKALGGAFAVYKIANKKKNITVSTATAGNHGRSVAWGAQRLGLKCKIFVSEFVSESRADAMRKLDAEVIRVKGNYDDSLKACIKQSTKNNWEIVQDVSWDGYKEVPKLIMAGYTIMIKEILDKIDTNPITHVFLQAGVGGMAAAMVAGFAKLSKNTPKFITVEPENADCVFQSIKNGKPTTVNIKKETIMGGMSCGDISSIAWEILKDSTNYCVTIPDEAISSTVALLAKAQLSNEKIIGGECAVPGIISLIGSIKNSNYASELELNEQSNVLLFGCEGLTDNEMYQKLLNDGLKKI